jgi:hypothetical protein
MSRSSRHSEPSFIVMEVSDLETLVFAKETVDGKQPCLKSGSAEGEAGRPTGALLQNQSVEMAKEVVPPVDLNSDEREARNQKATKADDAKVPEYLWDDRIAKIRAKQLGRELKQLGRELDSGFRK